MMTAQEIEAAISAAGHGPDQDFQLAHVALLLAALDRSGAELPRYHEHLQDLSERVAAALTGAAGLQVAVAALAGVVHEVYGYHGDQLTYDDPQNSNLMAVIDRRRGIPVSLGILILHALRSPRLAAEGVTASGLAFPGHFLIRVELRQGRAILDPFGGSKLLGTPDLRLLLKQIQGEGAELTPAHYAMVPDREVLLRLVNNQKTRAAQRGDLLALHEALRRMMLVAPNLSPLGLEFGLVNARMGRMEAAADALERCLAQSDDARIKAKAASALQQVRRSLN